MVYNVRAMPEKAPHVSTGTPSGLRRLQQNGGIALVVAGAVLLALVGGYYAYGIRAKAAIDDYSSERARPVPDASVGQAGSAAPVKPSPVVAAAAPPSPTPTPTVEPRPGESTPSPAVPTPEPPTPTPTPPGDASGQRTGPSGFARVMDDTPAPTPAGPSGEGPAPTPTPDYAAIIEQDLQGRIDTSRAEVLKYAPASSTQLLAEGSLPAVRIRIPVVGIDSDIKELEVIDKGDSRAWETPAHVVGHIPTTALPGEPGHGWYFGHLESPFSGEGNVFGRLPELAELFTSREDSPFYIFLYSENLRFAYQIYRTEIVHSDDFALWDSEESDITLVTCYPRFMYDYRLLVTAALVGVRES